MALSGSREWLRKLAYGLTTFKDSNRPLVFFLDNEDVQLEMNESDKKLTVKGSPVNDLYFQNVELVRRNGYDIDSLVAAHPSSPVSAYFVVKDFAWKMGLEQMKSVRAKMDASLDGSFYAGQLDALIQRMEKLQVGAVLPDFTLPDVDGNPVSLSGLRGKYVLIDFWASWCPDCRKENPNLVAAWQKYKDKNFTILGVSLDRKKEPWVKAIEKDWLDWMHVSPEGLEIGCCRAVCHPLDTHQLPAGSRRGHHRYRAGRPGLARQAGRGLEMTGSRS